MSSRASTHAAAEPYRTRFDATVTDVDGTEVTLDETYFYPESGGQPADRGTLAGVAVADVQKRDGVIMHELAEAAPVAVGDDVTGHIDESFRAYCRRAHTASHVVYGAGRDLLDAEGYAGFDIGTETIHIDFETTADPGDVDAAAFERLTNRIVWEARDVTWYETDYERAAAESDIVFNMDAEDVESVRIVEIEDWDVSACGGTHVRNTRELGLVAVRDVTNPGAGRVRVEYAVGPAAVEAMTTRTRSATEAAERLGAPVTDIAEHVDDVLAENADLRDERDALRARLLDARLDALADETMEKNGESWLAGTVEDIGTNAVSSRLGDGDLPADVVALAGRDGATFVVVATTGGTDASDVVADVTDEFGGGGGGGPTLAQGGGIDADPETIVAALRE